MATSIFVTFIIGVALQCSAAKSESNLTPILKHLNMIAVAKSLGQTNTGLASLSDLSSSSCTSSWSRCRNSFDPNLSAHQFDDNIYSMIFLHGANYTCQKFDQMKRCMGDQYSACFVGTQSHLQAQTGWSTSDSTFYHLGLQALTYLCGNAIVTQDLDSNWACISTAMNSTASKACAEAVPALAPRNKICGIFTDYMRCFKKALSGCGTSASSTQFCTLLGYYQEALIYATNQVTCSFDSVCAGAALIKPAFSSMLILFAILLAKIYDA